MSRRQKVHNLLSPIQSPKDRIVEQEIKQKFILKPKTEAQRDYLTAIEECDIVLCYGSAGSGKTFCVLGKAIQMLKDGQIKRVILVRPLQECGEKTGYLPGEKHEKIAPHMMAFTDLFGQFLTKEEIEEYTKSGSLRLETLGFMRGVTFREAFVILDEAQNCTYAQLKMFLTRIGYGSKLVLDGDISQSDLPDWAMKDGRVPFDVIIDRLDPIDEVGIIEFTDDDIVRHGLIQKLCKVL